MQLKKFIVNGLYGTFDHTINFNNDEKITIIIGQNGLGKTLILNIIKQFYALNLPELRKLYFDKSFFYFQDGSHVVVTRTPNDGGDVKLIFELFKNSKRIDKYENTDPSTNKLSYTSISSVNKLQRQAVETNRNNIYYIDDVLRSILPESRYVNVALGIWLDKRLERNVSSSQLVARHRRLFPEAFLDELGIPRWLSRFGRETKVRLIETSRLVNKFKAEDGSSKAAVVEYSNEILSRIAKLRAEANDFASNLDRTYPKRLMEKLTIQEIFSSEEITESLDAVERKRKFLNQVGLVDVEEQYIQPSVGGMLNSNISNVLMLYIQDSNSKLEVYDELAQKIELFLMIINKRFLFKSFRIDRKLGFVFTSTKHSTVIPISNLSSGEQHELVLFYQLLFHSSPSSLVLIDEPEISLHISWQKQFIDDIKDIIKINELDIVIATHSPDIIGNNWELTTQLEGFNFDRNDQ